MKEYNWNEFTKRIAINAPSAIIYHAWATQEGLEKWFLRKAEFTNTGKQARERNSPVEQGDTYEWSWFGYPDSNAERSGICAANGHDYLQFGFAGNCTVSVSIKKEKNETICELVQNMDGADEKERPFFYVECGKGWTFYLANLKSILEGGIDLRNKNEEIQNVVNA
jgi:hypothetical protein